jgi:hypothetical protein
MNKFWDFFSTIFFVALIYLMVKPSSKGPDFVKGATTSFASLLEFATAG